MAAWRERAQAWQPAAPTLSAFSVIKPRREASLALQALQFPAARGWSPAEGPWTKASSSLHPWPRPAGPLQQGREPEFAGSRPRRPQAGEETANPDPSSPRFHRPPARPGSAPPARPPGPRTSRKVSVFISLQGVSTIRAASRTPSVALAKHWGGNAGCGWGGGRGTGAPPLPVTPPGPSEAQRTWESGRSGLLTGSEGQAEGDAGSHCWPSLPRAREPPAPPSNPRDGPTCLQSHSGPSARGARLPFQASPPAALLFPRQVALVPDPNVLWALRPLSPPPPLSRDRCPP